MDYSEAFEIRASVFPRGRSERNIYKSIGKSLPTESKPLVLVTNSESTPILFNPKYEEPHSDDG